MRQKMLGPSARHRNIQRAVARFRRRLLLLHAQFGHLVSLGVGRRLNKLLKRVRRQFHARGRGMYAWPAKVHPQCQVRLSEGRHYLFNGHGRAVGFRGLVQQRTVAFGFARFIHFEQIFSL